MSLEVLKPVSKNVLAHKTLLHEHTIGNAIKIHSQQEGLPSLANVNIAIFGVLDSRKTQDYLGQEFDFDEIRTSFYELFPGNWHLNIADLGDLEKGHSVEDTYAAVTAITKTLLKQNIIPIILGGGQDLVYAQYRAYDNEEYMVNLVNVDAHFDLGNADESMDNRSFMSKIVIDKPYNLFNYSNIGFQTYYNAQEEIDLIERLYFDAIRLGEATHDIKTVEPVMRDANIVSVDISSLNASSLGSHSHKYPNGFDGREICSITRYAGLSDKVSSFSICELQGKAQSETSAMLVAQMLWYFIEGVTFRRNEHTISAKKEFIKYQVPIDEEILVFYKSPLSERWWIEIPFFSDIDTKLNRSTLLPCNQQDYLEACNQNIPQRWWKARQKNEL
jgi:arginase family enzyme